MTRDELLAALLVERYDNRWWTTPPHDPGSVGALTGHSDQSDDDLTIARRRRELADDFAADDHRERGA